MDLLIEALPLLKDNYAWLLHERSAGVVAVVDPSEAEPVIAALKARGLGLDLVINTHHHWDHVGGNAGLKAQFGCRVVGPVYDRERLTTLDDGVGEGDVVSVGAASAKVLHIPGHTTGHIALWFAEAEAVFVGDTLFSLGCGRMFEGTPAQMWTSLLRLAALPGTTRVYCGHEYTVANARFACAIEPHNRELSLRTAAAEALRAQSRPTVPTTVREECQTNPFLRVADAAAFGALRAQKDVFPG